MPTDSRIILECSIEKTNEKGVFTASQILATLHGILPKNGWKHGRKPWFTFEIVARQNDIAFYFHVEKEHQHFFEDQLYSQYPTLSLRKGDDPIQPFTSFRSEKISRKHFSLEPIRLSSHTREEMVDPFSSITGAMTKIDTGECAVFHVDFTPLPDDFWRNEKKISLLSGDTPDWIKKLILNNYGLISVLFYPFRLLSRVMGYSGEKNTPLENTNFSYKKEAYYGYGVSILLGVSSSSGERSEKLLSGLSQTFSLFSDPNGNAFHGEGLGDIPTDVFRKNPASYDILNTLELAEIVHLPVSTVKTPGVRWILSRKFEPPHFSDFGKEATPIGVTNFRGKKVRFGIQPADRARHMYIIGKTGMGKSTLLENMIHADIVAGRGVAVIDPHGDLAETVLRNIPKTRTNDVILFDPSDRDFPMAFNMLETPSRPELIPITASGLLSVFKRIFGEKSWGPRLEYILRNTILTLLLVPDATLLSIPILLTHKSYRKTIVAKIDDPVLRQFWTQEFEKMPPNMMSEAVSPILNKVGQFLSSQLLRNILGQPKNTFSLRWIMDHKKIFVMNLSKGKIGEDGSDLLGSMMVTKFQLDAMTRADIPEKDRVEYQLYVDEFQNFATDSFATILSEARKYKLSLLMANQYVGQMSTTIKDAIFGNVGTIASFQLGYSDAIFLQEVFGGNNMITAQDIMNLPKYDIYLKLLIQGMPSPVFSATTLPPLREKNVDEQQNVTTLLRVNREKYTKPRALVEKKIKEFAQKVLEEEKMLQQEDSLKKKDSKK